MPLFFCSFFLSLSPFPPFVSPFSPLPLFISVCLLVVVVASFVSFFQLALFLSLVYILFRLINSVINSAQLIISFKLFIVAVVLPLPLPLIGTTSLVLGGLTVDPEWGLSLPRPWGGWSWHISLPPTASRLCWCRSVSQHVVRGSPCGPFMVGGLRCRLPPGRGLQPQLGPGQCFRGPATAASINGHTDCGGRGRPPATHRQGNPDPGAPHFGAPGHSWATGGQNQGGEVYRLRGPSPRGP